MTESTRCDKWLWAVRLFKTRALAAKMCAAGKVKRRGHTLKPATTLQPGDPLEVPYAAGPGTRHITVLTLPAKRISAPQARACYEEHIPPEVSAAREAWQQARQDGLRGRPTKRDRRTLERHRGFFE
jgi:ribosome-associated heat shock protein Hsp15